MRKSTQRDRTQYLLPGWAGLTLVLTVVACATPPPPPDPFLGPLPPSVEAARDVVVRVQQSTSEIARLGKELTFDQRRERLLQVGLANFDLSRMAELSYGGGYRKLSTAQQETWLKTFILFYSSASAKLNSRDRGQSYRLVSFDQVEKNVVIIRTAIRYPRHAVEIVADYRLMPVAGEWKIFDRNSPPSVSENAMRRAEYRTILEKEGFDGLILDMDRRIAGYSAP
ncbi:MAG: ABC transporter substrate-binding protein [Myxococcota bacterium]|jgi:phospholipid transport system substrate-binding protein|nr:ABC transporter substrate-binding protein [Myxococcota bacterium]